VVRRHHVQARGGRRGRHCTGSRCRLCCVRTNPGKAVSPGGLTCPPNPQCTQLVRCVRGLQEGLKYTGVEYSKFGSPITCIARNARFVFTGDAGGNIVAYHPFVSLRLGCCSCGCWRRFGSPAPQTAERIWNTLGVGEVVQLNVFEKNGMEFVLAFYQLIDSNGIVLDGRIRVWNANVRYAPLYRKYFCCSTGRCFVDGASGVAKS
jgi:hypothetical protein